MKTIIGKICMAVMAFTFVFGFNATTAYAAGGLNAAEQRAISSAKKPFEYNGKTYVVNDAYISQATAKLSADGVDMSESEASQYISQFGGSHQELVEEGYCDEISSGTKSDGANDTKSDGKKKDENKSDSSKEKQHSAKTSGLNRVFLKKLFGEGKKKAENAPAPASEEQQAQQEPEASPAAENVWSDEEETLNTVSDITSDDVDYTYADKVNISYKNKQYDSEYVFLKNIFKIKEIKAVWLIILTMAVLAFVLQLIYIFAVKKRGHKKRKFRCLIAIYSGIVIGCIVILMILSMVLKCGFLNKSAIDRELMESDYFSGAVQTVKEMGKQDLKSAGYDESMADEVFKLSDIYITQKQYIKELLKKGIKKTEFSNDKVHDILKEKITKGSEKENKKLIKDLEDDYKLAFSFRYGDAIYRCNKEFNTIFIGIALSTVITFLIMFYMILQMYEYKHKSVRVFAFAMTIASVPAIIAGVALRMLNIASKVKISPVYYQDFLTKYFVWSINICIYMGLIGLLLGIILFFVKNYLHRLYVE